MARKIEPKEITTEVWGINLVVKGSKLGVIFTTPQGERKIMWAKMPPKMTKFVNAEVDEYLAEVAKEAALTPAQQAEKHEEMMGS